MKKYLLPLLALSALVVSPMASAQPGAVTPTATPYGPTRMTETPHCFHFKVALADITALAGTNANIKLWTTQNEAYAGDIKAAAPKTLINSIVISPTTPVTGGSLSAVTAQVKTGNSYGTAKSVFTATGATITYTATTSGYVEANNVDVNLNLVATGGNLSTATAGELDVYVTWTLLR